MLTTFSELNSAEEVFRPLYEDHDYFLQPSSFSHLCHRSKGNVLREVELHHSNPEKHCNLFTSASHNNISIAEDCRFSSESNDFGFSKSDSKKSSSTGFKSKLKVKKEIRNGHTKHSIRLLKPNLTINTRKCILKAFSNECRNENCALVKKHTLADLNFLRENVKNFGKNPLSKFHFTILKVQANRFSKIQNKPEPSSYLHVKHIAATIISKNWMRYVCRSVFLYLRNLIYCYREVSPALLLRSLNPNEATLMDDPATGAHLHFRLGGYTFPPLVMYKIYSNCPVIHISDVITRRKKRKPLCYTFSENLNDDHKDTNNWRQWRDHYSKYPNNRRDDIIVNCCKTCTNGFRYNSAEKSYLETKPSCGKVSTRPLSDTSGFVSNESIFQLEDELLDWAKNL